MMLDWVMPAEDRHHSRTFLTFGAQEAIWGDLTADVQKAIGALARTIARFEPVTVLYRATELESAKFNCAASNVSFIEAELDDIWMRDIGPNFVVNAQGELGAVDFNFNGWGGKQQHEKDSGVARLVSDALATTYIRSRLHGEGGGIEVDGYGTAILTESCWINDNRNPSWSKQDVEAELRSMLGLRKIIWLPGIKGRDITDAHVDFYARFTRRGEVVANLEMNPASFDYDVTREHLEILKQATDADGNRLRIHTLAPPLKPRRNKFSESPDFAPGYINYLPVNDGVIAPEFGDAEADARCRELLAALYPGREIVQLNTDAIAAGGGGIHCVTGHQPMAKAGL